MGLNTKEIVKKHNIRMTKSLGQNFLIDDSIVKKIVDLADVNKSDLVIEVGPGVGSMTVELASRAGKVIAIEIDKHLIPILNENLKTFDNVSILNEDILKVDLEEMLKDSWNGQIKVVANLPYYITTPIIMRFLEDEKFRVDGMVFMIQKEVAQRMNANPGGKDYGALSVAVQYYSEPQIMFNVPPASFIPKPEVDSTVIKLNIRREPAVQLYSKGVFFKTVKAAFAQRRKTLLNALSNSNCFNYDKETIKNILESLGISPNLRGETLNIMQFAELANAIFQKDC